MFFIRVQPKSSLSLSSTESEDVDWFCAIVKEMNRISKQHKRKYFFAFIKFKI